MEKFINNIIKDYEKRLEESESKLKELDIELDKNEGSYPDVKKGWKKWIKI